MTDRAAGLLVLAQRHAGTAEASDALSAFEHSYAASPLVMDKWFLIQASAPGDGTLARVRRLMSHPAFSIKNPNRVRSLLGTFFSANQTAFTGWTRGLRPVPRRDPRGRPAQSAARLTAGDGAALMAIAEPVRQGKAREALVAIAGAKQLSADVRDIVERTLG